MNAIPLKSIEGCLVAKFTGDLHENEVIGELLNIDDNDSQNSCCNKSYNLAITQQGEVKITLNREKLAIIIFSFTWGKDLWEKQCEAEKSLWLCRADAILNALPELVEVVK